MTNVDKNHSKLPPMKKKQERKIKSSKVRIKKEIGLYIVQEAGESLILFLQ